MLRRLSMTVAIGLAVGGCSLLPAGDIPALSSEQVSKIATEITVLIDGCDSGSGVLYKREGKTYSVLTAKHTVDKSDAICLVIASDGIRYQADAGKVTVPVPGVDLAVLTFQSDKTYKLAEWGDSEEATAGKIVYVAGAPAPSEAIPQRTLVVPEGKIVGRMRQPSKGYGLIYNNLTLPGMSGGPVLDEKGRVIGIHGIGDKKNGEKTGLNLGIPIQIFLTYDSLLAESNTRRQLLVVFIFILSLLTTLALYPSGSRKLAIASRFANASMAYWRFLKTLLPTHSQRNQTEPAQDAGAGFSQAGAPEKQANFNSSAEDSPTMAINPNSGAIYYINVAEDYYSRGNARYNSGEFEAALADYNEAIRIDPNYAKAYNNRGLVRSDLGDFQAAIADYSEAIRLNPNLALAYNNRGLVRRNLGDKQGALADYNEAIRLNPDLALAYNNRGLVRRDLEDSEGAVADFDEAIRLNPNYADAYYNRGLVRRDREDKQEARKNFKKAAALYKEEGKKSDYRDALNRIKELSKR